MKTLRRMALRALGTALMVCAGGCSVLAPQKDESKFFLLSPVGESDAGVPASQRQSLSIGIGPVTFPQYLKRPEIVTRVGPDQLKLSEDRRWAEPLGENFQNVLAQDLSQMLATQQVEIFPWFSTTHIDYQVVIQVSEFDVTADGQSRLNARWSIKDGANGNVLFATQTISSSPVSADDPAGTAALSRDVADLGRQIADRIRGLNAGGAVTSKS
jgi:uncharacterized lipoprotein YmbA